MKKEDAEAIYQRIKCKSMEKLDESKHCAMILKVMADAQRGTVSAFCVEAGISEMKFYGWLKQSEVFKECYNLGKMMAREAWEALGREIYDEVVMPGTSNYKFEYWRMIGWARFGIGKNSRIRLDLDHKSNAAEHYSQLIKQASDGDFTAGEIKQLMEAINVGLNVNQTFNMQKQIDELTENLKVMVENSSGNNSSTNQRTTKKD